MSRRSLAALIPVGLVAMLLSPVLAAAQEASPGAELGPPSAAECQTAPRSEAEIAALGATPTADADDAGAPIELPEGTQVDDTTRTAIEQTLREVIACAQARDLPRLLALYSDEAVRQFVLADEPEPIVPGQPRDGTGTRPATPSAAADLTPVVQEARLLPDGRVAALVTSVAPGSAAEVVIFVQSGNRWLIDEIHPLAMPEATPITGADNPVVQAVLADAAGRLSVPADELQVVSFESWEWPDASLGCPEEGGFYAQVITPGYLIVVTGAGEQLEYHTDTKGHFVLCKQG
ncbi:MAG: hypothetical protein QOG89_3276 [Thermomicrobiales bacterium]|nr:hypothetical protein [Thermomicrobiales bacterium]